MNSVALHPQHHTALHPWIGSDPAIVVANLETEANRAGLISKISFIAIAAISLSVLAIFFFYGNTTALISFSLLCPVLATPCIALSASKFQSKAKVIEKLLEAERPVEALFREIQDWDEKRIEQFFKTHNLSLNPTIDMKNFLPLIARFETNRMRADEIRTIVKGQLKAEGIEDRGLRLIVRNMGWNLLEMEALPAALEAAFALQIMQEPYRRDFPSELFDLTQKSFDERMFDRIYGPDDLYLTMKEGNKPSFTLEEMSHLSPDELRIRLFEHF